MKRRGFLKRLAGVATAAVVSEKLIPDDGVALGSINHPGMGLAPIKAEGSVMLYDDLVGPMAPDLCEASLEQACITIKKSGVITRAAFREQLADGLNKAFEEAYADYEPDGWPKPG